MSVETIAELRRLRYNATVIRVVKPNPELMILRVRPDFALPPHDPGQYTTLGLGNWEPRFPGSQEEELKPGDEVKVVRRAYSMSCSILADDGQLLDRTGVDWVEFYVVLVKHSDDSARPPGLTPRLFMLREGDRLQLGERFTGRFTLADVKPTDTVLFLSTGTGEAPHNYMLWQLLARQHHGRIVAACCVRYRQDLAYLSTHETLTSRYSNYTYIPLTTREAIATKKTYIQDLIVSGELEERIGLPLNPAATHVYLCGNPKMIGVPDKGAFPHPPGVIELLHARGFVSDQPKARGNIHYEEYW